MTLGAWPGWFTLPIWGCRMHHVNGFPLYWLGTNLGNLAAQLVPGVTFQKLAPQAQWSRGALSFFIQNDTLSLKGSRAAAQSLADYLDKMVDPRFLQGSGSSALNSDTLAALTNMLSHLGSVLSSELALANTFFAATVRGWDMSIMTAEAELTLSEMARRALTDNEIKDVRAAGRCLAFEVPTAAAFHLYRALESVVLKYMPLLSVSLKDSDRNLGNYIRILKDKGIDSRITTLLEHIKDQYRNPAIHPGLFFDVDGAASQFALIQSVIHMMAEDISARQAAMPAIASSPPAAVAAPASPAFQPRPSASP